MDPLISVDDLKDNARISHDFEDDFLQKCCARATEIVIDYLEASDRVLTSPVEWDIDSVPVVISSAMLEVATNLYRNRGDIGTEDGPLTRRVRSVLERYRRPALA